MPIVQCSEGHRYDSAKFKECPFCKSPPGDDRDRARENPNEFMGSSIGLMESTIDRSPVAGWLVCVKGPERGRDYRIRAGKNSIGRSWKRDISITKDQALTPTDCAYIVYSEKDGSFCLLPGEGEGPGLNGAPVTGEALLEENDRICFGESEFVFVPYCRPGRRWEP